VRTGRERERERNEGEKEKMRKMERNLKRGRNP